MKKLLLNLGILLISVSTYAQDLVTKVPANASVVVKYSGEKLSQNVSVKKIDSYQFVKKRLMQDLGLDSTASIEQTGINFEKDAFQYFLMEDSSTNFITLVHLKDAAKMLALLQKNNKTEIITVAGKPYKFLSIADDKYLGWSNDLAVLVYTSYTKPSDYYYPPVDSTTYLEPPLVDSVIVEEAPVYEPPPPPAPPKKKTDSKKAKSSKKDTKKKNSGKAKKVIEEPVEEPEVEIIQEEALDDAYNWQDTTGYAEAPYDNYGYDYSYTDSIAQVKKDEWYKQRDVYIIGKQKSNADSIINSIFTGNYASINSVAAYQKITDPSAHIATWLNYDNLMSQLWSTVGKGLYGLYSGFHPTNNKERGFSTGINLYFEKDQLKVNQKMYSPDAEMTKLGKEMFRSKQKSSIAGFVNPDHIAYFSASFNTAAVGNYYYKMLRQYLGNMIYLNEYADLIDVYIDLMEIVIDEKGIAEVMPGNMAFVLHDMKPKTITYTDYEYDEDFNQKEIKKTKQELSPNFTFAIETKRADFMRKLAAVPVKYAEKHKFNYSDKGGYFELVFDGEKNPLTGLYFVVKDDKVVITTSKEVVDLALKNGSYKLDAAVKKSILKNNYSVKLNTNKLIQQLGPELSTATSKSIKTYLEENLGNVLLETRYKDDMIQSTGTMAIKGVHSNSFEFLFNVIEKINEQLDKDKASKGENLY